MKLPELILLLFLATLWSCQADNKQRSIELPNAKKAVLLSSGQAKLAISQDEMEGFFDRITRNDIQIQLKKAISDTVSRKDLIQMYKESLQADVMDFTSSDKDYLYDILKKVGRLANNISPDLVPEKLQMIKVGGKIYGPNVFYTRENNIIVPAAQLQKRDDRILQSILLHELFHIYSRYNPEKKEALYQIIGFEKLVGGMDNIEMPKALSETILYNPDGVDYAYGIRLKKEDEEILCIPLTSSNFHHYSVNGLDFFPHMSITFYEVVQIASGKYKIVCEPDGSNPISFPDISKSLFDVIGNNTMYFIHPDEIMADNFSLIAMGVLEDDKYQVTEFNREILEKVEATIKE